MAIMRRSGHQKSLKQRYVLTSFSFLRFCPWNFSRRPGNAPQNLIKLPGSPQRGSGEPTRGPRGAQEGPKIGPERLQEYLRKPTKAAQKRPGIPQDGIKKAPKNSKEAHKGPKRAPGEPQKGPRRPSKMTQDSSGVPDNPQENPRQPSGNSPRRRSRKYSGNRTSSCSSSRPTQHQPSKLTRKTKGGGGCGVSLENRTSVFGQSQRSPSGRRAQSSPSLTPSATTRKDFGSGARLRKS